MKPLYKFLARLWVVWLLTGTVFYAYNDNLGWASGFYMAVNVGYSIGWGDISEVGEPMSQLFSIFFVICGSSFVAAALGIFADNIVSDNHNWYEIELREKAYAEVLDSRQRPVIKIRAFINFHWEKLRSIFLWLIFLFLATICAMETNAWSFVNALYFAISTLSTGGLYAQSPDRPEWVYGLTGLYAAFGIPIMALAMATLASFIIKPGGTIEDTLELVKEPVSEKEVKMLTEFGIADEDGEIDQSEFVMLMMVRTGAASPELIKLIMNYFKELDEDGSGSLSLDEICQNNKTKQVAPPAKKEELVWAIKQREDKLIQKQARRFSDTLMQPVNRRLSGFIDGVSGSAASIEGVELQLNGESEASDGLASNAVPFSTA